VPAEALERFDGQHFAFLNEHSIRKLAAVLRRQ
jgi:hypothetical protein